MFAPDLEDDFADRDVSLTSGNHSLDTVHFRLALRRLIDVEEKTIVLSLTLLLRRETRVVIDATP